MDDLISRQAAIDVLKWFTQTDTLGFTPRQIVEALPSAQPEQREEAIIDPVDLVRNLADRIGIHQLYAIAWDMRGEPAQRTGRWIDDELICKARCSVCGEEWSWMDNDMDRFLFCPNCGSYNGGEDE